MSLVAGMSTDCTNTPSFISDDWMCDGTCYGNNYCGGLLWDTPICGRGNLFKRHCLHLLQLILNCVCAEMKTEIMKILPLLI